MDHAATRKELRHFGLLVGAVFTVIGLWPLVFRGEPLRLWAIGIGGLLIAFGGILPQLLRPIHKGWMWVGHVMGWVNTRIILGILFYGMVTPMGVFMKLTGRDPMRRKLEPDTKTYRVMCQPRPASHMKNMF